MLAPLRLLRDPLRPSEWLLATGVGGVGMPYWNAFFSASAKLGICVGRLGLKSHPSKLDRKLLRKLVSLALNRPCGWGGAFGPNDIVCCACGFMPAGFVASPKSNRPPPGGGLNGATGGCGSGAAALLPRLALAGILVVRGSAGISPMGNPDDEPDACIRLGVSIEVLAVLAAATMSVSS